MNDREVIRSFESVSSGKVVLIIGLIMCAVAMVIGLVVSGFHGQEVKKSAAAVTESVTPKPPPPTAPAQAAQPGK
jgi:hypothetical protein